MWRIADPRTQRTLDRRKSPRCARRAPLTCTAGGTPVPVLSAHDDYAVWFTVGQAAVTAVGGAPPVPPACTCLQHVFCGRERILQLNDAHLKQTYADALAAALQGTPGAHVLSADDGLLLPLVAAEAGAAVVDLAHLSGYARRLHPAMLRCVDRAACVLACARSIATGPCVCPHAAASPCAPQGRWRLRRACPPSA